jgi:proline iminopeptidase
MEYALAHQEHLKGLIISNMNASIPSYNEYARTVIMPGLDQAALAEIQNLEAEEDYANPRYEALMFEHHYTKHILRKPLEEWPADVMRGFKHLNYPLYLLMQGPSELGASGRLLNWDRRADMNRITVPTLVMAAEYDTMNPAELKWMSEQMPQGQYHVCPDAGHVAQYDAPECYFPALIEFIKDVNARD